MNRDQITRQSTTDEDLLYLLGVSQWVFNSNCAFIIEMIDKEHHNNSDESWNTLLDLTAGTLKDYKNLVKTILTEDIYDLFYELVEMRNAIIHSLPSGKKVDNYPVSIYRNTKKNLNFDIDKRYLQEFIKKNEKLSLLIHEVRGS